MSPADNAPKALSSAADETNFTSGSSEESGSSVSPGLSSGFPSGFSGCEGTTTSGILKSLPEHPNTRVNNKVVNMILRTFIFLSVSASAFFANRSLRRASRCEPPPGRGCGSRNSASCRPFGGVFLSAPSGRVLPLILTEPAARHRSKQPNYNRKSYLFKVLDQ